MRSCLARFAAIAALLFTVSPASAQGLPKAAPGDVGMSAERLARIGPLLEADIAEGLLPGAVVMVARRGSLVYAESFGFREPAAREPMTEDAIFRIYSMTKPLVSVAAMILVEDGRLQLTDPVGKYLPGFDDLSVSEPREDGFGRTTYTLVPAEGTMTVQDLLRHTAGLAYGELTDNEPVRTAYAEAGAFRPEGLPFDARHVPPSEQVAVLAEAPLIHHPGTVWVYSFASDVLGRVVEAVAGMRLGDFLADRLFEPLAMADSGFHVPGPEIDRLAEPLATDPDTGEPVRLIDVSEPPANDSGGAGGVSTAADYLRFSQMLLDGGALNGTRILSPATVKLMASDHLGERIEVPMSPSELLLGTPGYTFGLGFAVREQPGIAAVHGSEGEFTWGGYAGTYFWIDPEEELAAVFMSQAPGPRRQDYRRLVRQLVYQAIID